MDRWWEADLQAPVPKESELSRLKVDAKDRPILLSHHFRPYASEEQRIRQIKLFQVVMCVHLDLEICIRISLRFKERKLIRLWTHIRMYLRKCCDHTR